ncbi:MAG: UDP-N-acetylmuramoyl-L-alanyl-D-glutamate--2,6-diaminopimelate ligase [Candidatus Nomurabacteria bacterium]|jgi:UDP-N-acetylmuramoyl-L-alanyl-D-glutamate--2,6-diaminopimelate ligase|nr:UDP-N-acetylmuramoyl-L-alanyl-D-glutamate--2,6-diaminopimelate ligase [Candidatus Nomurabacteria bacterium]
MNKLLAKSKKLAEKLPGYDRAVLPWHRYQAFRAATKNDYPASGMKVIGVTGTNGKTTTSFMIHRMLVEAGKKTGILTTIGYGSGKNIKPQIEHMTTVDPMKLNKRIAKMAEDGVEYLVLELTSHALVQYRAFGIPIDVAVETNVTHEHLDYHKTFKKYRDAKIKLFKQANATRGGKKVGIINADDPSAGRFRKVIDRPITYGIDKGDVQARQVRLNGGADYFVKYDGRKLHIKTQIPGVFNIYNSLAAVIVGIVYGLTNDEIEQGIAALDFVEGRMNRIDEGQKFEVVMDYAHTPDSFEKLLPDMKKSSKGRLIVVFGSAGGRRDPSKRRPMGEIAGRYADVVILTEEDDRDTPGEQILKTIASGAEKSGKKEGKNLFKILDRTTAIDFALKSAKPGDTVLLLGKGNEKTIERSDGEHPWDEAATARRLLKQLKK